MRTLARNLRFALSNLGHYSVNVTHIFARDLLSENQFMINYIKKNCYWWTRSGSQKFILKYLAGKYLLKVAIKPL